MSIRNLVTMTTSQTHDTNHKPDTSDVFADPVAYLASFGIDSELVAETSLPAAA